jgi:hypothetical protein
MKMKSISLLLCITLFIFSPSILLAKQICLAPSGCSIEMDTGFCPNCIEVKEEPPIIKEEKVVVVHKPIVKIPQKKKPSQLEVSKTKKKNGVCYVKPCDWLQPPSRVSQSEDRKPITRDRNWVGILFECIVGCKEGVSYWDEGGNEFDKNLNLILNN